MNPIAITILIGLAAGVIGGLLGVGGGIVMVPCFKYFLQYDMKTAIGTSLAAIAVGAIAGAARHAQLAHVNWRTAAIIALFVAAGSYWGADLTQKLSNAHLQKFFAAWMIGVGIYLFWK